MSEGTGGTFEYTKPRYEKNDMLNAVLHGVGYGWGIGFINSKLSSKSIVDTLPSLNPKYKSVNFADLDKLKKENTNAKILFVTGLQKVTLKEYEEVKKYQKDGNIKKIIFLSEDHPNLSPFMNSKNTSFVFEDGEDGFYIQQYHAKNTDWSSEGRIGFDKFAKKITAILSKVLKRPVPEENKTEEWSSGEKHHYYQDPKNLMQLFQMARERSKKLSVTDETRVWSEYKRPPTNYELEFYKIMPEGLRGNLKKKKESGKKTSVVDIFTDPAMVRTLKREGLADAVLAVGASDSRTNEEAQEDKKLNIPYIAEPETAGVWSGRTWRKIKDHIQNTPLLAKNNGFDLVVACPVRGWQIGEKPPFQVLSGDTLGPPFELQYVILSRMWELVGNEGSLVIQMPHNSHKEMRLYEKQLKELGFDIAVNIDDRKSNFRSELRINRTSSSPKTLPKPSVFRAPAELSKLGF